MATNKIFYKGFSSRKAARPNGSFSITNKDVINEDLMNHIFTEYWERSHMPSFGTRIPTLVFEPNDEEVRDIVREDLTKVFNYDPRVTLVDLQILSFPDNNAIVAIASLFYIELKVTGDLKIEVYSK